jgi:Fic family protein
MHIETRGRGRRRKFYLARSYRLGSKVRKDRIYLGTGLGKEELKRRREAAEERLEERERLAGQWEIAFGSVKTKARKRRLGKREWERFVEEYAYNSNAIDGSSITMREVRGMLGEGQWPFRPKHEIAEAYGAAAAAGMLARTKEHLSLSLMLGLHGVVFRNSRLFAGKLRRVDVVVRDRRGEIVHRGAPREEVKRLLLGLVEWYYNNRGRRHPLVLAAVVHCQFENIHPFQDGTGRVGRLLMSNILLRHGYPPVVVPYSRRQTYYAALQAYERGRGVAPMVRFLEREMARQRGA